MYWVPTNQYSHAMSELSQSSLRFSAQSTFTSQEYRQYSTYAHPTRGYVPTMSSIMSAFLISAMLLGLGVDVSVGMGVSVGTVVAVSAGTVTTICVWTISN